MERLNIFNPYKDKEVTHEDVLTRNFLILLKNIPSVQVAFFELIRENASTIGLETMALGKLSVSEVDTQVSSGTLLRSKQEYNILSVYISNDKFETNHEVQESERKARYDGVVVCDPSWIFIIENKPYVGNAWEEQLDPNYIDASGNTVIKEPCCLSWGDVIEVLSNVLEHNISTELEKILIEDFLAYINEAYSWLNPYSRLSLCNGDKWLIDRRCGNVLKECFPGRELKPHKGWKHYIDTSDEDEIVRRIALDTDNDYITLFMYAGDVMNSARALYERINLDKLNKLTEDGYLIRPNFHISFRGTGLVWLETPIETCKYADYWKHSTINQVARLDLEDYCESLSKSDIVLTDRELLKNKITSKDYQKLNICPGLFFGYKWKIEEAVKFDNSGRFKDECLEKINRIRDVYWN